MTDKDAILAEKCWIDQCVPIGIASLAYRIENHPYLKALEVRIFADERYLKGYHRSANWIARSTHCTDKSFSVNDGQRVLSDIEADYTAALDIFGPVGLVTDIATKLVTAKGMKPLPQVAGIGLWMESPGVHVAFKRHMVNSDHTAILETIIKAVAGENAEYRQDEVDSITKEAFNVAAADIAAYLEIMCIELSVRTGSGRDASTEMRAIKRAIVLADTLLGNHGNSLMPSMRDTLLRASANAVAAIRSATEQRGE